MATNGWRAASPAPWPACAERSPQARRRAPPTTRGWRQGDAAPLCHPDAPRVGPETPHARARRGSLPPAARPDRAGAARQDRADAAAAPSRRSVPPNPRATSACGRPTRLATRMSSSRRVAATPVAPAGVAGLGQQAIARSGQGLSGSALRRGRADQAGAAVGWRDDIGIAGVAVFDVPGDIGPHRRPRPTRAMAMAATAGGGMVRFSRVTRSTRRSGPCKVSTPALLRVHRRAAIGQAGGASPEPSHAPAACMIHTIAGTSGLDHRSKGNSALAGGG